MTTTIDSDGRATGDTTPTRVLDLQPGDVIQTSWNEGDLAEVLLTTPIDSMQDFALLVFAGGKLDQVGTETTHQVVTGERAQQWRADRDAAARRDKLANQLLDLAQRFRERELPMPLPRDWIGVSMVVASRTQVEQAAKALGVEVDSDDHGTAAYQISDGLTVLVRCYESKRVDA